MLKYALLAGGMLIASPVLAQTQTTPAQPAPPAQKMPSDQQTAPVKPADPAQPAPVTPAADPASTAPAKDSTVTLDSMTAQTDPAKPMDSAQPAPAEQAAQPAAKGQQVAQVVNSEFASYDKDKNGSLNESEFDAWMVALKTAADPATKADAPDTKSWMNAAFAQADVDKDKAVSKAELTGFLSIGQG